MSHAHFITAGPGVPGGKIHRSYGGNAWCDYRISLRNQTTQTTLSKIPEKDRCRRCFRIGVEL